MHVLPETVYQALYGRGSLDLAVDPAVSLPSGRTGRRLRRRKEHRNKRFPDMVMIRDRPVEVIGRLVPGHWEGDLIIGKGSRNGLPSSLHPADAHPGLLLRSCQPLAARFE